MYVSFDDGDHWQSLMLNLPTTSYRDIAIKDNDLIVSHVRARLLGARRHLDAATDLVASDGDEPRTSSSRATPYRVRRNVGADTPFPPEVPHALNPPEGAIIDYWLAQAPTGDITLDVLDSAGVRRAAPVQRCASRRSPEAARPPHPNFWVAPPISAAEERRREPHELGSALRRAALA